ncbi:hypothetical protein G9A89_022142 [Geosiphon pyriformis]|nr:hypothetical protein G9A89_022142 [Geosiphon pyriformis]
MDGSLNGLGTLDMKAGAAVFFKDINLGLGVEVSGLVSSTMAKLQVIALAFECVPFSHSVDLFLNSQTALNTYKLVVLQCPAILGILFMTFSNLFTVHTGDFYLAADFTSAQTAGLQTYFIKTLHHYLLVAVHKCLYNRSYSSVICLFCGDVEVSDHVFSCPFDAAGCARLVEIHASAWKACLGLFCSSLCVSQLFSTCFSNVGVGIALCKSFVFKEWYYEFIAVFKDSKIAVQNVMAFVHEFCLVFHNDVWLVCAKHRAVMKKDSMIPCDDSVLVSVFGLSLVLSAGMVRLLGIADTFGICFGFHKSCLFFSGLSDIVSVHIST